MIVSRRLVSVLAVLIACVLAAPADAYIYWVDNLPGSGRVSRGAGSVTTTIARANLDGSGVDRNFITGTDDPCGVAVDAEHIYWVNRGTFTIARANLDGTGVDESFITIPVSLVTANPCAPAVNSAYVYWSNFGGGNPGSIGRANLDGSGVSPSMVSGPTVENPFGVALNSQYAFWTNTAVNAPGSDGSVYRQTLDPLPPEAVDPMLAPADTPRWPSATEDRLFYAVGTHGVRRSDLDGANPDDVVSSSAHGGTAVLDQKLYWADSAAATPGPGTINRSNLDGSSPETLIADAGAPRGLAVDAGVPSNEFSLGKLKRNKRKGTAKLSVEVPGPGELALSGNGVEPQRSAKRRPASTKPVSSAGTVTLKIKPEGKKKRKLNEKGKAKLKLTVIYTPTGGTANAEDKRIKLVKK